MRWTELAAPVTDICGCLQNFGNGQIDEMYAPKGYGLMMATRVLVERCARAKLLENYQNVQYCMPCKVEDVLFDAQTQSVNGESLLIAPTKHATSVTFMLMSKAASAASGWTSSDQT